MTRGRGFDSCRYRLCHSILFGVGALTCNPTVHCSLSMELLLCVYYYTLLHWYLGLASVLASANDVLGDSIFLMFYENDCRVGMSGSRLWHLSQSNFVTKGVKSMFACILFRQKRTNWAILMKQRKITPFFLCKISCNSKKDIAGALSTKISFWNKNSKMFSVWAFAHERVDMTST